MQLYIRIYLADGRRVETVSTTWYTPLILPLPGQPPVISVCYDTEQRFGELTFRDNIPVRYDFRDGYFSLYHLMRNAEPVNPTREVRRRLVAHDCMTNNDSLEVPSLHPYVYIKDHLGSVRLTVDAIANNNGTGNARQGMEYLPSGAVFRSTNYAFQPRRFCEKELVTMHGWNMYDSNARFQHSKQPRFSSIDPLAEQYYNMSPYNYAGNDPVNAADPSGESPVYNIYGKFLGTTKEGFTGTIIILKGTGYVDVSNLSSFFLLNTFGMLFTTLDGARDSHLMTDRSLKNVYNNVIKYFDGISLFGRTFSYRSISGGIKYDPKEENAAWYTLTKTNEIYFGPIPNSYEYTVENIASSVIVHEWYSHMISKSANTPNPHSNAYFNVMLYKPLWKKTTDKYKAFVNNMYWYYVCQE